MTDINSGDRNGGFVQPDAILPVQFFQTLRSKGCADGERRLMIAVLVDAVNCFMKQIHATDPVARQLFEDAEAWITAEDRTWFFSFDNVCGALDLNPEYIRDGLFKWRAAERRRVDEAALADERSLLEIADCTPTPEAAAERSQLRLLRHG